MLMCTLTLQAFDKAFSRRMQLAGHPAWGALPSALNRLAPTFHQG
jgi:hypothetical protein